MPNGFKAQKRTYKEIKEDPNITFTWIAWALDRKIFYVALIAAAAVAATPVVQAGLTAFAHMNEEYEEPSPYLSIDPAISHGVAWSKELIRNGQGLEGWTVVDNTQPSHGFLKNTLGPNVGPIPATLLSTTIGATGPNSAFIQVYGAGQARKQFDIYVESLRNSHTVEISQNENGIVYAKFGNDALIVAGDSLTGIKTTSPAQRDDQLSQWLNSIQTTLPESSCVSMDATKDESARSIFYGADHYIGLQEIQTIDTDVNVSNLPTVTGTQLAEIAAPTITKPEEPLPANFEELPSEVQRPALVGAPRTEGGFSVDVSYMIEDPVGPGCGWVWSAQRSLEYDSNTLEKDKKNALTLATNELNQRAQTYVASQINWARSAALFLPKADDWNSYVNKVNHVHSAWAALDAARVAFLPTWDEYIAAHEAWRTFDERQASARKSYDEAMKVCTAQNETFDTWMRDYQKESENQAILDGQRELEMREFEKTWEEKLEGLSGEELELAQAEKAKALKVIQDRIKEEDKDRVKIPPKPAPCAVQPEKPEILDLEKPEEPTEPTPPENVTIPNSWPRPTA